MQVNVGFKESNSNFNVGFKDGDTLGVGFGSFQYVRGADGVSPTIDVSSINGGNRLTINDAEGTKTVDIMNGKDGKDGTNGKDGYTPVKGVDYFDGKDGASGKDGYTPKKGVDYFDGRDGQNGINGKDGKDGADGHTPVKGKDYFTDADKTEMVSAVIAALPKYNGEVVSV